MREHWQRGAWDPDDSGHLVDPLTRENHDFPDYDPDGELDRWLGRFLWGAIFLALWKLLELAWWAMSALMAAFS